MRNARKSREIGNPGSAGLKAIVLLGVAVAAWRWPTGDRGVPLREDCPPCKDRSALLPALEAISPAALELFRTVQEIERRERPDEESVEIIEAICVHPDACASRWPGLSPDELTHAACWAVRAAGIQLSRPCRTADALRDRLEVCIALMLSHPSAARRVAAIQAAASVGRSGSDEFTHPLRALANDPEPWVARSAVAVMNSADLRAPEPIR